MTSPVKQSAPWVSLPAGPFPAPFMHGWLAGGTEDGLKRLVSDNQPQRIVEVGAWLGMSTRLLHTIAPKADIHTVDTWLGSQEHHENPEWRAMLPALWETFWANMLSAGIAERVKAWRMTSIEAADIFVERKMSADLVYIDAAHDYESVKADVLAWSRIVPSGGHLCGDDFAEWWPSVQKGVRHGLAILGWLLESDAGFWWSRKP